MEIVGTPGQQAIDFPAAQLAKLEPGIWALYVVRRKTAEVRAAGGGPQALHCGVLLGRGYADGDGLMAWPEK
jgi:hypothetical protein